MLSTPNCLETRTHFWIQHALGYRTRIGPLREYCAFQKTAHKLWGQKEQDIRWGRGGRRDPDFYDKRRQIACDLFAKSRQASARTRTPVVDAASYTIVLRAHSPAAAPAKVRMWSLANLNL